MASSTVREGTEVFCGDGKKIGRVKRVFSAAPEAAPTSEAGAASGPGGGEGEPFVARSGISEGGADSLAMERAGQLDGGVGAGVRPLGGSEEAQGLVPSLDGVMLASSDTKYLEIHHGGHFGFGGESVYVPLSAVERVDEDGSIVLRFTTEQVVATYSQSPQPLD